MRRSDKEIVDKKLISAIIRKCQVCRIALAKEDKPYIVPISFGYDGMHIYFHSTIEGKKIDFINANNRVCFEFELGVELIPNEINPCKWTFSFQSVIGEGKIIELITENEKRKGLNEIMKHYSGKEWSFSKNSIEQVRVWKIIIEMITGKQSKDKISGD